MTLYYLNLTKTWVRTWMRSNSFTSCVALIIIRNNEKTGSGAGSTSLWYVVRQGKSLSWLNSLSAFTAFRASVCDVGPECGQCWVLLSPRPCYRTVYNIGREQGLALQLQSVPEITSRNGAPSQRASVRGRSTTVSLLSSPALSQASLT